MNIDTGHVADLDELRKEYATHRDAHDAGWREVPAKMTRQARRQMEREQAVDLSGHSPLAKFARNERKRRRAEQKKGRKAARKRRR